MDYKNWASCLAQGGWLKRPSKPLASVEVVGWPGQISNLPFWYFWCYSWPLMTYSDFDTTPFENIRSRASFWRIIWTLCIKQNLTLFDLFSYDLETKIFFFIIKATYVTSINRDFEVSRPQPVKMICKMSFFYNLMTSYLKISKNFWSKPENY